MEKTFLRLDKEVSIMILSGVSILFTFLSAYSPITNLVSFCFLFVKSFIFLVVPLIFYILEKRSMDFKKVAGIYTSYFIIDLFLAILVSISMVNGDASSVLKTLFDFVNLVILLSGLFIFIEQVLEYGGIRSKVYSNTIMKLVYSVSNFVSYPFLNFINRKVNKKDKEE